MYKQKGGLKSSIILLIRSKASVVLCILFPVMALRTETTDFTILLYSRKLFLSTTGDSALKLPYFNIWPNVIRAIVFFSCLLLLCCSWVSRTSNLFPVRRVCPLFGTKWLICCSCYLKQQILGDYGLIFRELFPAKFLHFCNGRCLHFKT